MSEQGETSPSYCIFQQPWWLNAVAGNQWEEIVLQKGGKIIARMPYILKKKWGLKLSLMPAFTQALGPWIQPLDGKYATRLSRERKILKNLAKQLPVFDYFDQNFHYSITNWLPFYWQNFEQTTRYTYVIDDLSDPEKIWGGFKGNIRREIRKAQEKLTVVSDLGVSELWRMYLLTFERQNTTPQYSFASFKRLDNACKNNNARKLLFAVDDQERTHAALYVVWDANAAYYLIGGADPELRNSGASSLLMWETIKYVSGKTEKFDFEGSMIESIERFFRGFGGHQKRYFRISKMSRKVKLLQLGREALHTISK